MAALHLSAENFKQEVLEAKGKVLQPGAAPAV